MKVSWTTDSAGMMQGFSYHDAILTGLEFVDVSILRMRLSQPQGVTTIELSNLDMYTLTVWNGAIIGEIFAWPVGDVPEAVWDIKDGAWYALLSGRSAPVAGEISRSENRTAEAFCAFGSRPDFLWRHYRCCL